MPITFMFSQPMVFVAWLLAVLIALTIHEFSHGLFAFRQGDPTAKIMGRISLNPLRHIDIFGFLAMLFLGFGWAKPVPINPIYFKNKKWGNAIVSIAGPMSNLFVALFFGIILKILYSYTGISGDNLMVNFLYFIVLINLIFCIFNLIPIPPLDGSHVLFSILGEKFSEVKYFLSKNGPIFLFGIIMLDLVMNVGIFSHLFSFFFNISKNLIFG